MFYDPSEFNEDPIYGKIQGTAPSQSGSLSSTQIVAGFDGTNWLDYAIDKAKNGDEAWQEKLWNYYASEDSLKTARDHADAREDSYTQRLVKDMGLAGISPYILSGISSGSGGYTSKSYSGTELTSRTNNKNSTASNESSRNLQTIMRLIGVIGSALIMAAIA